jgi:transcription-repair coupling factor (superfamily II helicase)
MIPDHYVRNISERLSLYNELARVSNEEELAQFGVRIEDRFGKLPKQVNDLIKSVRLKWLGRKLGFEKIVLKQQNLNAWFTTDDRYFQGEIFGSILEYIRQHPNKAILKQNKDLLTLRIQDIKGLESALNLLAKMES